MLINLSRIVPMSFISRIWDVNTHTTMNARIPKNMLIVPLSFIIL